MGRYNAAESQGTRVLTDDELRRLWQATEPNEEAPQQFHALFGFLLLTGARRREATDLPWTEINGSDWLLPAARHKNKTALAGRLSKAAQAVLEGLPDRRRQACIQQ
jgi:integrase